MPDHSLSVSPDDLTRFGFCDPDAATQEIAELAESIFGPFDPVAAEGWALSAAQDLDATTMRQVLGEAAEAEDPLGLVVGHREARAMLERHLHPRWSSPRGRALGHPPGLQGQSWASLSEAARKEVREALRHLRGFWASRVRRHRPKRDDLDTFLRELAEIFVVQSQEGDRRTRARRPLRHRVDVPHSPTSRFIRLAEQVLANLPLLSSGEHRIALTERTARGLSERWKRIKEHETTDWADLDGPGGGNAPA